MVEGREILPTTRMLEKSAGYKRFTHCSAQQSELSYPGSGLAHHCTMSLSSRVRSVSQVRNGVRQMAWWRTLFPAPSRPTMITENSSFLSSLSTCHDKMVACYTPGQIFVKALEKVVHEERYWSRCVTRTLPSTARNNDGSGILLHLWLTHLRRRCNCPVSPLHR